MRIIKLDAHENYGFLSHDEDRNCPALLFNSNGEAVWAEGARGIVMDSAAGNTSGSIEGQNYSITVGYPGFKGVSLFNSTRQLWNQKDTNVWHIEMLDVNSDGRDKILEANGSGRLIVRDTTGKSIAKYTPGPMVTHFSLTRWESEPRPTHILVPRQSPLSFSADGFFVLDSRGQKVAELSSPTKTLSARAYATPVNFGPGAHDFAVVVKRFNIKPSTLLIYDQQGKIVYQEVIDAVCEGIDAIPAVGGQQLLLGCDSHVFSYSLRSATVPKQ